MKERIYDILNMINSDADFSESTDFLKDDLLDSFNIIELVSLLESELNIKIPGLEIVPENFSNIESIMSLVEKSKA